MRPITSVRSAGRIVFLLTAIFTLGLPMVGCDIINPDEGAQEARVEITGDDSGSLDLITSMDFTIFVQPESSEQSVDLNSADTSSLNSLPFEQTYDISPNDRFFVRLTNPDSLTQPTVGMKVTVDGKVLYNSSGDIGGAPCSSSCTDWADPDLQTDWTLTDRWRVGPYRLTAVSSNRMARTASARPASSNASHSASTVCASTSPGGDPFWRVESPALARNRSTASTV